MRSRCRSSSGNPGWPRPDPPEPVRGADAGGACPGSVGERVVPVRVGVRLARRVVRAVLMPVMRVVAVGVGVRQRSVSVRVLVPLGQV